MPGRSKASCERADVKSVVVIGNGPSAITLSYLLSGNVPYYKGGCEDAYVDKKLARDEPIVLQDIEYLSQGCEGRSNNEVSVFFDMLTHPGADFGSEGPPLVDWRRRKDLEVDHVVLGKGRPGGCWESMDGDFQTVSLGNWMELPNLKFSDVMAANSSKRVKVSSVAEYYQEYIHRMLLDKNFVNHSVVTGVKEITECPARACTTGTLIPKLFRDSYETDNAIFQSEEVLGDSEVADDDGDDDDLEEEYSTPPTSRLSPFSQSSTETFASSSPCDNDDLSTLASTSSVASSAKCNTENDPPEEDQVVPRGEMLRPVPPRLRLRTTSFSETPLGLQILQHYRQAALNYRQAVQYKLCSYMDECSARDGEYEDYTTTASSSCLFDDPSFSWDPIVNPEHFGSLKTAFSSRKNSAPNLVGDYCCDVVCPPDEVCTVNDCFPGTDRLFEVSGYTLEKSPETGRTTSRPFTYLAKNIVLATGSTDVPNSLGVPGEDEPFVLHSLKDLEAAISRRDLTASSSDPLLVVGAGLSAADAIVTALNQGVNTVHAFRKSPSDPSMIFKKLPSKIYPEYHRIYKMMSSGDSNISNAPYSPLAEHRLSEICENREVRLVSTLTGESTTMKVSFVVILIGSSPNMSFLEEKLTRDLGVVPDAPIDRGNPVNFDLYTNQAVNQRGIYAMGPLVGDNFVRFLQGGALAITGDILRKMGKDSS